MKSQNHKKLHKKLSGGIKQVCDKENRITILTNSVIDDGTNQFTGFILYIKINKAIKLK